MANYLPLISVNFIAVAYQFGLGPVGWSYTGEHIIQDFSNFIDPPAELFPVDMRAFLSGLCNFATNLYIFLVIKTFPDCKCAPVPPPPPLCIPTQCRTVL